MAIKDTIVPIHRNMLTALDGMLAKALAHEQGDALLTARLAEDMHPLATQIRYLCNMAGEALERLTALDFTSNEDDPETLADARARIAQTLSDYEGWASKDFVADDAPIELALPNGMTFDLTAAEYARDWAAAQFYFHTVTAYSILRHAGLEIGKADFVPYMFAYLRQPEEA